jgi:hypothetical protein
MMQNYELVANFIEELALIDKGDKKIEEVFFVDSAKLYLIASNSEEEQENPMRRVINELGVENIDKYLLCE